MTSFFRRSVARQLAVTPDEELRGIDDDHLATSTGQPDEVGSDTVIPMVLRIDGWVLRLFSTITPSAHLWT